MKRIETWQLQLLARHDSSTDLVYKVVLVVVYHLVLVLVLVLVVVVAVAVAVNSVDSRILSTLSRLPSLSLSWLPPCVLRDIAVAKAIGLTFTEVL